MKLRKPILISDLRKIDISNKLLKGLSNRTIYLSYIYDYKI